MTNIFAAYSDESFQDPYHAISVVSGRKNLLLNLREELQTILNDKNIKEVKFSDIRTYPPKIEAAKEFIDKGIEFAKNNMIRIDVLILYLEDFRHSISDMDDVENWARMYYKVLRCISERWNQIKWEIYPDEQYAIKWYKIVNFLNRTNIHRRKPHFLTLFEQDIHRIRFIRLKQLRSYEEPLIQLADLFAGIVCFSRKKSYECWIEYNYRNKQQSLFRKEVDTRNQISESDLNRFEFIFKIYENCKESGLKVSYRSKRYLWTPNPSYPMNFWHYEPKSIKDKAPQKV